MGRRGGSFLMRSSSWSAPGNPAPSAATPCCTTSAPEKSSLPPAPTIRKSNSFGKSLLPRTSLPCCNLSAREHRPPVLKIKPPIQKRPTPSARPVHYGLWLRRSGHRHQPRQDALNRSGVLPVFLERRTDAEERRLIGTSKLEVGAGVGERTANA